MKVESITIAVLVLAALAAPAPSVSGQPQDSGALRSAPRPPQSHLELDSERCAVLVDNGVEDPLSFLRALLAEETAFLAPRDEDAQAYRKLCLLRAAPGVTEGERLAAIDRIDRAEGVRFASVVFRDQGTVVIPKPEIIVTLEDGGAQPALEALLGPDGGCRWVRELPGLRPTHLLALDATPARLVLERARELARMPGVRSAEPNHILRLEPLSTPSDPLFADQWHHQNTGQNGGVPGSDLASVLAWNYTSGSPAVTIAIIDEGVDVDHEDLAANMAPGHDSTDQPSPGGIPGNAATDDEHGTSCAGIAAAVGDNSIGAAGVCWSASLMPVRVGYGAHWTEVAWQIDAITWATDNGADVLSNSWGGGPPSSAVQAAIEYAITAGRGGLGCVVLFAAGNSDSSVIYPAKYPETIAVGASSPCDERKSPASCDGESWWGSNHGLELDLVAPGVQITTTDNMGAAGADPGNYRSTFNGTSAACPAVAGAAALLLTLLPDLTADEARLYLSSACEDQVGNPAEDTPGWDSFMGWGRLNLSTLLAFTAAPRPPTSLVCQEVSGDIELGWQNGGAYDTIEVRRDGGLIIILPGNATSHVDAGAPFGPHDYDVRGLAAGAPSPGAICSLFFTSGATELVWAPPSAAGAIDGGGALVGALAMNNRSAVLVEDLASITDLNTFDHIWVNLGVSPNNHVLAEEDALRLAAYLEDGIGGSQLYMEGADTWAFDPQTSLHPLFQVSGMFDGISDLDLVVGSSASGCDLSGITLTYGGELLFIDRLAPVGPASSIQTNTSPAYDCAVFHDAGSYRTIGASHEFGGYLNGTSNRDDLMAAYLSCLFVAPAPQFLRGDANGSGAVNVADVVHALNHLFMGFPVDCRDAVDASDDGALNIGDPVYQLQFLFAGGPPPPIPYPTPGPDPTPDLLDCAPAP